MIGRTVGSYVILDRLGSGGMGEVYLAQHRRLDRRAAIKVLLPGLSRNAAVIARFFNEARALSRIQHDGIVQVIDCDVADRRAYIVMEHLDGESLAGVIARGGGFASEPRSVAAVVGRIADALAGAHDKGIVHRDLKPENVFLALGRRAPFQAKILDFGIAKLATDNLGASAVTQPGILLGTPSYMAPEQCRGLATFDHRVDVYALGCILFELLAGRKVFEIEAPGDLLMAHVQAPPPRVVDCAAAVPNVLDELVAAMLAKEPDGRPQTMRAVVSAVEQFLDLPVSRFEEAIPATSRLIPSSPPRRTLPDGAISPAAVAPVEMVGRLPRTSPFPPDSLVPTPGGTQLVPEQERKPAAGAARRRVRPIAVAIGAVVMAVALIRVRTGHSERPNPKPSFGGSAVSERARSGALAAAVVASAAPPLAFVAIRVDTVPSGARVNDAAGKVIGQTPFETRRERADAMAVLTLTRAGFTPRTVSISLAHDATQTFALERSASPEREHARAESGSASRSPPLRPAKRRSSIPEIEWE
jgi:serine/threonine protein kinase